MFLLRRLLYVDCKEAKLTLSRTGSKCLPVSAISKCHGMVLHDSHAEVLALRALSRFLLSEVHAVLQRRDVAYVSPFVCFRSVDLNRGQENLCPYQPFQIRGNVLIWMFSTEAPCGDASMEILMGEKEGDVEPWDKEPDPKIIDVFICKLRGRLKKHGIKVSCKWGLGYFMDGENKRKLRELIAQSRQDAA